MSFAIRAKLRYLRMSPRKARLVTDVVRGMSVNAALDQLTHIPNAAAWPIAKLIRSAVANANENFGLEREDLFVSEIAADPGPTARRGRFGGRGRFKPILKRSCHISVALREIDPQPLAGDDIELSSEGQE